MPYHRAFATTDSRVIKEFSHINASGEANMVDVGGKQLSERSATASGIIRMLPSTLQAIKPTALRKERS